MSNQESPQAAHNGWPPPQQTQQTQLQHQPLPSYPVAYPPQGRSSRFGLGIVVGVIGGVVLAVLAVVAVIVGALVIMNANSAGSLGEDPHMDQLYAACGAGDMASCDDLYEESAFGSDLEEFGATCGGRLDEWTSGYCTDLDR